jgi:tetratricopeptide (TPR) repeat protein
MSNSSPKPKKLSPSGRVGGPATFAGITYQTEYAVLQTLDLISKTLVIHGPISYIGIEPRVISGGVISSWDIISGPPDQATEAKEAPNAADVVEFLSRVSKVPDSRVICKLLYSKGSPPILSGLYRMKHLALESGDDSKQFQLLVEGEKPPQTETILANLGDKALSLLKKIETENLTHEALSRELDRAARQLAGSKSQQLLDFLFRRLTVAAPSRLRISVDSLVREITELGIELYCSPASDVAGVDRKVLPILFCLQSCGHDVPTEVISDSLGECESDIQRMLRSVAVPGLLTENAGYIGMRRLPTPIPIENGECVRGQFLRALLSFITRNKHLREGRQQIANAMTLAKLCGRANGEIVATLFDVVEKPLKRAGNKLKLFEAAEISIAAVRSTDHPTKQMRESEAKALICGRSWVYQRMGETEKARVVANESLKLGNDLGYDRNTAYCKKCIGRLCRIEAEETHEKTLREALLKESAELLIEAIHRFSKHQEFGPQSPEIGDCYSLLGRTYLAMGDLLQVTGAMRKAQELLRGEASSKEYADLLILEGDLLAKRGALESADETYAKALKVTEDSNAERNEIVARAHFRRGLNQLALKRTGLATTSLTNAAAMWKELGETELSANAKWYLLELNNQLPSAAKTPLSHEKFAVRVEVAEMYLHSLPESGLPRTAKREDPGGKYWKQLISQAKKKIALEVTHF